MLQFVKALMLKRQQAHRPNPKFHHLMDVIIRRSSNGAIQMTVRIIMQVVESV